MAHSAILNYTPKIVVVTFLMLSSVMLKAQIGGYTFVQQSNATTSATAPCSTNDFNWSANSYGCHMYSSTLCSNNPYVAETTINLAEAKTVKVEILAYVCLSGGCNINNLHIDIYIDGIYVGYCSGNTPSAIYNVNLSAGTHTVRYEYNGEGGTSIDVFLSYQSTTTATIGAQYISADGSVTFSVSTGGSIVMEGLNAGDEVVLSDAMGRTERYFNTSFTTTLRGIVNVTVVSPQKNFRQKIMVIE